MKLTSSIATALLATVATARPRSTAEGDPLPQKSRITAFVISPSGEPSLECWEMTSVTNSQQIQRHDGSKATSHAMSLAKNSDLDGIEILTWPSLAPIYPPPAASIGTEGFEFAGTFNLFNVQSGLINFNFYAAGWSHRSNNDDDDDDVETHIFSLENGDDWFYFEDLENKDSARASSTSSPFTISTISGSETEVLRLMYNEQPKHKVVHKGACGFTGIKTDAVSGSYGGKEEHAHSPLTVQVKIEDL